MLVQLDTEGTARTIAALAQVDADGTTVRTLQQLWQNDTDGTPRLVFEAGGGSGGNGGATVSPDYAQGTRSNGGSVRVTTSSVSVSLVRSSPVSLTWSFANAGWEPTSPGALATAFRSPPMGPGSDTMTTAFVTATYAGFADAVSNTITLNAANSYSGGLE